VKATDITGNKQTKGIQDPLSPRLLDVKTAAEYTGLSVWTIRKALWDGHLSVVLLPGGRKQWIDVQDLEALIQRCKTSL
jgi:excisionase family DNA binding protein